MSAFQIDPICVIAGILYNLGDKRKAYAKPDDGTETVEIEVPVVDINRDGDDIVCVIPLDAIKFFQQNAFSVSMQVARDGNDPNPHNKLVVISFSPQRNQKSTLLNIDGRPIQTGSPAMDRVLAKFEKKPETPEGGSNG